MPALNALPQEVSLLRLAPRHHLAAQGILQLERVRHFRDDVDYRADDLGRSGLGDRHEEQRRRLQEVDNVREPARAPREIESEIEREREGDTLEYNTAGRGRTRDQNVWGHQTETVIP